MSVVTMIRDFVAKLEPGEIFVTRQLLSMAKRSALDQGLHRLVKRGYLCRLARGVFCINASAPRPALRNIVEAKMRAFGKTVVTHGELALSKFGLRKMDSVTELFACNGCSSSFKVCQQVVHFQRTCSNRVLAGDGPAGCLIRALFCLGHKNVDSKTSKYLLDQLAASEILELRREKAPLMTGWMSDILLHS